MVLVEGEHWTALGFPCLTCSEADEGFTRARLGRSQINTLGQAFWPSLSTHTLSLVWSTYKEGFVRSMLLALLGLNL